MRTTAQKVSLFRRFFTGRTDVYGTYDPTTGRGRQVKEPVTDNVVLAHLRGQAPYGVYLLTEDRTRAAVADFDADDLAGPMSFITAASAYGLSAYLERSKRKGYHAWIFFASSGVLAAKARSVVKHILTEIGAPATEVFPKQDRLADPAAYGNFINAPLFGRLVPQGRTVFVEPSDPTKPCPNQWDLLERIQPAAESTLDEIIAVNELSASSPTPSSSTAVPETRTFGLPPCARRMLAEGVTEQQRLACFWLAVHLQRAGVPQDLAIEALKRWARKNKPIAPKTILREDEMVSQVASAYRNRYRVRGCDEPVFAARCRPACPLLVKRSCPPDGTP